MRVMKLAAVLSATLALAAPALADGPSDPGAGGQLVKTVTGIARDAGIAPGKIAVAIGGRTVGEVVSSTNSPN